MTLRRSPRTDKSPNRREPVLPDIIKPNPRPIHRYLDLNAIRARFRAIVTARTAADVDAALIASVVDVPELVSEVERLRRSLVTSRIRHANLTAAARATLAAVRDRETDPLYYLRDELAAQQERQS